ncbi:hypothetical protein NQZ68_007526 [Dissostichus eleginoides]|nr:hypothetical protein NQZ68_007526 [Dissostichus eleginoides]
MDFLDGVREGDNEEESPGFGGSLRGALNGEPEVGFELGSVWFRAEFRPSLDIVRLFYRLS